VQIATTKVSVAITFEAIGALQHFFCHAAIFVIAI
jgi:hypothetical protein